MDADSRRDDAIEALIGSEDLPTEPDEIETALDQRFVELYDGQGLTLRSAGALMGRNWTRVIVPLGLIDSGKTTLICGLYDQLLRGGLIKYAAGSRTLMGLERRSHEARLESRRPTPQISRTGNRPTEFLHFDCRSQTGLGELTQVLIADVSGERFRDVRNLDAACDEFTFVGRADAIPYLIDGSALLDPVRRANAISDTRLIVRRLLEHGYIQSRLDIVVSKNDLIKASGDAAAISYIDEQIAALAAALQKSGIEVRTLRADLLSLFGAKPEPTLLEMAISWFTTEFFPAVVYETEGLVSGHAIDQFVVAPRRA